MKSRKKVVMKYLIILLILLISSTTLAESWFYEDPMRALTGFAECWLSEYMECRFWDLNGDDIVNFNDYVEMVQ